MKTGWWAAALALAFPAAAATGFGAEDAPPEGAKIRVVATLPDYAFFARRIGGERTTVESIVLGNQDAHFIRPKPSFVDMVRRADVLIATGLDLELWLPAVVDRSGNSRVRSGQIGYVSAARDMRLLEIPESKSRAEGGVHVYGNPHVTASPIQMRVAARNIAAGLTKNDRAGKDYYERNLRDLVDEIDRRLFGAELVELIGGDRLCALAGKNRLIPFLQANKFRDRPLIDALGGWLKKMLPLRGAAIVTYHTNWVYFCQLFGIEAAGTVEPKPGIPPSPKHVTELVEMMRARKIGIILAANYFDEQQVRTVAARVGAVPLMVPLYVGGAEGAEDYFALVDLWTDRLLAAHERR